MALHETPEQLLVSAHVGAMYVASPVLGRLVDAVGSRRVALVGVLLFTMTGLLPSITGSGGVARTAVLLVGLGLAWNTQVVAGSAMLHESTPAGLRPRAEARGELAMSLGAAAASLLLAPPLLAAGGLPLLAATTVPLHLLLLPLLRDRHENRP